ncbi:hypothetical protein [Maribacter halichondriae]|uniref:hypothetical protein n=1 Tax=Maribacter halichondriae TaxID=2980554 RepID=UPI002358ED29|nr:hypothetical protein [Maribacter sp. Hal144]
MTQAKMNLTHFIITVLCVGIFTSCQPPVVFGEPQPADTKPLSTIPREYHGIYWCKVDSASLFIDDRTFIKRKEFLIKLTKAEIDSSNDLELQNGRLYVNDLGSSFPIEEKGDTIISKVVMRDTIFSIAKEQILKPFKGHLILNTKLDENAWAVLVASHKGAGILSLARAEIPENFAQLDSVTPIKMLSERDSESTQIYITPTAEQFGRILDRGLLFDTSCSEFERIIPIEEHFY